MANPYDERDEDDIVLHSKHPIHTFMKSATTLMFLWGIVCIAVGADHVGEGKIELNDGEDEDGESQGANIHVDVFFIVYGCLVLVPPTLFQCLKHFSHYRVARIGAFIYCSFLIYTIVGAIGAGLYSEGLSDLPSALKAVAIIQFFVMTLPIVTVVVLILSVCACPVYGHPDPNAVAAYYRRAREEQQRKETRANNVEIAVETDDPQEEAASQPNNNLNENKCILDNATRNLLVEACVQDSVDLARKCLQEESGELKAIDVNEISLHTGNRPFHLAAAYGSKHVLAFLLDGFRGNPDQRNNIRNTALHYACMYGQIEIVDTLVRDYLASVNKSGFVGNNPLHFAAKNGHLQTLRKLILEFNADVNPRNEYGETPLHKAAEGGHLDVVKELVEKHGAKTKFMQDPQDRKTACDVAKEAAQVAVVEYLNSESMSVADSSSQNYWV